MSVAPPATGGTASRDGCGQSQGGGGGGARRPGNLFKSGGAGGAGASTAAGGGARSAQPFPPVEYTILLHPPLVIENLLPHAGTFELVDQVRMLIGFKVLAAGTWCCLVPYCTSIFVALMKIKRYGNK